jgi:hypothetical protein
VSPAWTCDAVHFHLQKIPSLNDTMSEDEKKLEASKDLENYSETTSLGKGDLLSLEHVDPVLNAKMSLVNDVSPTRMRAFLMCACLYTYC